MLKALTFLFLFSFLYSANIAVISGIPTNMNPGDISLLNYSLCLNSAQNYTLFFNMTNTTYDFSSSGIEFNFSNCSYNSTLYACPFYGEVGTNKIEINLSVNPLTKHEDYDISAFIELTNEATYGVCNPAPVVVSSSSGSSSGSGGGSFSFPRYFPSEPIEEPVIEPEPIKKSPKIEPKPIVKPKPVVPKETPKIEPEKPKSALLLEFDPTANAEPEVDYSGVLVVVAGLGVVLGGIGFSFWWLVLR